MDDRRRHHGICDFNKGSDGELPGSVAIVVLVDQVIADRRKKLEESGDPTHLEYAKAFNRQLRKKGRENPEIRRNFYLEDMVEEGNFVSRKRLFACARGPDIIVPFERLYLGLDWARVCDATVGNDENEVLDWFRYPKMRYEEQIELLIADLKRKRKRRKELPDGQLIEEEFDYFSRIVGVRGDTTGLGDFPMEFLQSNSGLPIDEESMVKFTLQSKHEMYGALEDALFRDEDDPLRFSYPADHELAAASEEQMTKLVREYKGDGAYLSVHHPDEPGASDD